MAHSISFREYIKRLEAKKIMPFEDFKAHIGDVLGGNGEEGKGNPGKKALGECLGNLNDIKSDTAEKYKRLSEISIAIRGDNRVSQSSVTNLRTSINPC